ncbi:MAG: pyridoxamine 5'-phosphate oxidase family protein [Caldilineales bacterium]|nr:pyridoxamine 5'-phosphate oxidase family protein [Caldilineales bacterium]
MSNSINPISSRPTMPEGYGLLDEREGSGLLPWSWAQERLISARNYWVCTTRPDGRPHASPVWGIWLDDSFLFGTDAQSRKALNLITNPAVVVHLESGDEVLVLEGVAREERDKDLLQRYADAYWDKYEIRLGIDDVGVMTFRLKPSNALGWLESDFPGVATRWRFEER